MKTRLTRQHAAPALLATFLLAAAPLAGIAASGDDTPAAARPTAVASGYAVHNGTVASGGAVATNGCYSLISTVGEAAAGTVSNGSYQLTSGFPATINGQVSTGTFTVFKDSFEGNDQGGCTP